MIARLIDGRLIPCPLHGKDRNGRYHSNLPSYYEKHLDIAAKDGYYPVRHTEKPIGDYIYEWQLINDEIVQVWVPYTPEPEPMPEPDPFQMRADIDYIAMMGEYDHLGGGTV